MQKTFLDLIGFQTVPPTQGEDWGFSPFLKHMLKFSN